MNHGKCREAFLQGEEKEAANLFGQLLRQSIRIGLLDSMQEEVEALCGPRYRPDPQSPCHRAGSESGVVCMDGGREQIQRPRVRHETDGEVRLGTYEAASSSRNLFDQIVASVAEGLPVRGVERVTGKAVSRSTASRPAKGLAFCRSRPGTGMSPLRSRRVTRGLSFCRESTYPTAPPAITGFSCDSCCCRICGGLCITHARWQDPPTARQVLQGRLLRSCHGRRPAPS